LRVLTTQSSSPLIQRIADALGVNYSVRMTDRKVGSSDSEIVRSELGHGSETNELVRGMDVIIHSGAVDPGTSDSDQLDYQMRCTYNLLWAAAEESVPRFIYLSSLKLMEGYGTDLAVADSDPPSVDSEFRSSTLMQSGEYSHVFDTPGTFQYFCEIHPNMQAAITVN